MGKLSDWLFGPGIRVVEETSVPVETRSAPPITIPRRSDQPMSDAMMLSTINVYRAVSILTTGAGQLTIDVWRGKELLERPALVRRPDVGVRARHWVKQNVASLALTGNAYWRVVRGPRNEVVSLPLLDPHECTPLPDGRLSVGSDKRPLREDEFVHLGLLPSISRHSKVALGPIQAARVELAGAVDVARYGASWFASGDVPSGVLKTDQFLSPQDAENYKQVWQSREAHEVAVLGAGLDYRPILLSPEDAQFVAVRQFDTTAVARLFGIPARLFLAVVEGGSMSYANVSQDDLSFVRWTLSDYTGAIEDGLSSVLPGLQEARFNLDGLIRPDIETRYRAHESGVRAGWLLRSEVRDIEGLPPAEGIDLLPLPTQQQEAL